MHLAGAFIQSDIEEHKQFITEQAIHIVYNGRIISNLDWETS